MLGLENQIVKQLAMSRNHLNAGDAKEPYMSIAYTEVKLGEKQIDSLMGFGTWRSWFNINGKDVQPMDWTKKIDLGCADAFKDVSVSMIVLGNKELEFDGCRLYIDKFKLLSGGDVMADIHLHVMKAKDSEWNLIGRAEYTEVKLSTGDGVLIERKSRRQRELFEGPDPEAPAEGEAAGPGAGYAAAAAARNDGDVLIWWQTPTGAQNTGKRSDMPEGCVEIDPPSGSASEKQQLETQAKKGGADDDTDAFAQGAARAVGAHMKRGSRRVIDGRSERVKHRDGDGAH